MPSKITSTDPEKFTRALLKKMQICTGEVLMSSEMEKATAQIICSNCSKEIVEGSCSKCSREFVSDEIIYCSSNGHFCKDCYEEHFRRTE